jgi:hypothetical protein
MPQPCFGALIMNVNVNNIQMNAKAATPYASTGVVRRATPPALLSM